MKEIDWGRTTFIVNGSAQFRENKGEWGAFSNMMSGPPLMVNDKRVRTSEALYQACRFPNNPEIQKEIIEVPSPMAAKMVSRKHRRLTRSDWEDDVEDEQVRVHIMRWCLQIKLSDRRKEFGKVLQRAADLELDIVERSDRDDFWGAKLLGDGTLEGMNMLGKLLMELWSQQGHKFLTQESPGPMVVDPPRIRNFLLEGEDIVSHTGRSKPAQFGMDLTT